MKKTLLPCIAACLFTFLVFFGCKKQELQTTAPMDNTAAIKTAVQRSQDQFARIASAKDQNSLKAITGELDYTTAAKLSMGDTATLFVVHLLSKEPGSIEKFYSIIQKQDDFSFDGIYESKNISTIKTLFSKGRLAKNDSVYVRSVTGHPTQAWVSSDDGKTKHLIANGIRKKDLQKNKARIFNKDIRLNLVDDNPENCVEWWMCEWDPEYGVWVPLYYLYTVGCENLNQPQTGPVPVPEDCQGSYGEQVANYQQVYTQATAVDNLNDVDFTTEDIEGDPITKNWHDDWECLHGDDHWGLRSFEAGTLRYIGGTDGHPWVWKTISHQAIEKRGYILPGTTITHSQGLFYPNFTVENAAAYNYYVALVELKFTVTYTFTPIGNCPIVKDLIGIVIGPITIPYVAHAAWSL
ncbi:MAG: hypothetical protein ABI581_01335 [Sediminibacterium sp.]